MKKKSIYTAAVSLFMGAAMLTSCQDWLDVYPSDEIREEQLFSTGDGFRSALNGIYRKMSTWDLYGSNLTWGIIDAWGQCYNTEEAPSDGGGTAMRRMARLEFKVQDATPTTDAMWSSAWNVVANCNELAQQVAQANPAIFYGGDGERQLILGEAIGLRAVMQFDLLRIYAPAPSSVNYAEDSRTFIPYVDTYPTYVNENQTVAYCLDRIIEDLKNAQEILKYCDKDSDFGPDYRYEMYSDRKGFTLTRGYRLNYYAVTAYLARVYLYAGKPALALQEALTILKDEKAKKDFDFNNSKYDIEEDGNMKLYNDIIFALYSPTELVDFDSDINHSTDGKPEYEQSYLFVDAENIARYYGDDKEKDWRCKYQLEPKYYNYRYRPLKYKKQSDNAQYGEESNQIIPMIRLSEIYYIAAEALYDTDKGTAYAYLNRLKYYRGVRNYAEPIGKEAFMKDLVHDAHREWLGEGQTLFMYKRLNKNIVSGEPGREEIVACDENFVLPKPDSEQNFN